MYSENRYTFIVITFPYWFRAYCNEDAYLMQAMVTGDGDGEENNVYDITLTEAWKTE